MEDEMEVELVFEAREIDPDYEFDAPMFFDFTSEELTSEALVAERWFDSARCYPPSPFVRKLLLREEGVLRDNRASPNCKDEGSNATLGSDDSGGDLEEHSVMEVHYTELTTSVHVPVEKPKSKSCVKGKVPRSSTLLKPTASLLAKCNLPLKAGGSRLQMLRTQKDRSLCGMSVVETHASKRQKLEGGHLQKVGDAKLQIDFIHKAPKKDGMAERSDAHSRPRLTIPKEPELETAQRAERTRPKYSVDTQHVTVGRKFKARPLNRKILEAPSLPLPKRSTPKLPNFQEFHLKTSERAMQHNSATSSSSLQGNDSDKGLDMHSTIPLKEPKSVSMMGSERQDACATTHIFKVRPLNKKIFTSGGDIGVFRNFKRETTVPTEFNFCTEKRMHLQPPSELFSKLSLGCELQQRNGSQLQFSQPSSVLMKGSKENRLNHLQPGNKTAHLIKERPLMFAGNNGQLLNNGCIHEVGIQFNTRNIGMR